MPGGHRYNDAQPTVQLQRRQAHTAFRPPFPPLANRSFHPAAGIPRAWLMPDALTGAC
jgi:hypothetical protein